MFFLKLSNYIDLILIYVLMGQIRVTNSGYTHTYIYIKHTHTPLPDYFPKMGIRKSKGIFVQRLGAILF